MPTIYEALKSDHDEHRSLLENLAETQGDSKERRKLWRKYYYEVSAHAAAEELAFYSLLISDTEGQSEARHSIAEHEELDDIIQELNDMDMSSPGWLIRLKTLKERYEHHIDEEEEDIFPVARKIIGDDTGGRIAADFKARKRNEHTLVDEKAESSLLD
ncbi:MAG: hemerythrin domain-containing protein [Hyphomonas sp.]